MLQMWSSVCCTLDLWNLGWCPPGWGCLISHFWMGICLSKLSFLVLGIFSLILLISCKVWSDIYTWYAVCTICAGVENVFPSCTNWITSSTCLKYTPIGRSTSMGSATACLQALRSDAKILLYLSIRCSARFLAKTPWNPMKRCFLWRGSYLPLLRLFFAWARRLRSCRGRRFFSAPCGLYLIQLVPLPIHLAHVVHMCLAMLVLCGQL